jgi:hypothetical protein
MPIIEIKGPAEWDIVPAEVNAAGNIFALDNLIAMDKFDDGVLDPVLWGTSLVQGSGIASVTEANGKVTISTNADDAAAILFYNAILSPRANSIWRIRYKADLANFLGSIPGLLLQQAGTPAPGSINLKSVAQYEIDGAGRIAVNAWFADLSKKYFSGAWQGGASYQDKIDAFEQRIFEFENDKVNLTFRILTADEAECLFSVTVPWADLKAEANDLYMTFGDPFTTASQGQLELDEFYHYGPYPTGQVISMGNIAVSGNRIEKFPVTTSGDVFGEYRLDNSGAWIKPGAGTDAEMQAALVGLTPAQLDLRYTLNSDGFTPASVNLDGRVIAGACLPSLPVIGDYIMPMLAELVRDQIALIVKTEISNLKTVAEDLALNQPATLEGQQAQADLDNGVYDIIGNIFIEKGTHFQSAQIPGLNIYYGRSDFSATGGDAVSRQQATSSYIIEVHAHERHEQKDGIIFHGDEKAARKTGRILGILRGIIMSGQYVTLGDEFEALIWRRRVTSLDVFQPDFQESDGKQGIVGILNINVEFEELGPEISGEVLAETISRITAKLRTADDGNVITIET